MDSYDVVQNNPYVRATVHPLESPEQRQSRLDKLASLAELMSGGGDNEATVGGDLASSVKGLSYYAALGGLLSLHE